MTAEADFSDAPVEPPPEPNTAKEKRARERVEKAAKVREEIFEAREEQKAEKAAGPEPEQPPEDDTAEQPEPKAEKSKDKKGKPGRTFGFNVSHGPNIKMQTIDWIWQYHLALGQHTCIAGVQGQGKSQLVYALAAAVSTGNTWPGTDERAPLGKVILFNAEDTTSDVMMPRLLAAGADPENIYIMESVTDKGGNDRKFNLQADLDRLTLFAAELGDVKLITFDPVSSYLGGDLDSHENTKLRDALDPITAMAEKTGAAVVSVTHFNKAGKGTNALNRVMGGAAFTAAPRAAFAVIEDGKNRELDELAPVTEEQPRLGGCGLRYGIQDRDQGRRHRRPERKRDQRALCGMGAKTTMSADEALDANNNDRAKRMTAIDEAVAFLIETLAGGPVLAEEVKDAANGVLISRRRCGGPLRSSASSPSRRPDRAVRGRGRCPRMTGPTTASRGMVSPRRRPNSRPPQRLRRRPRTPSPSRVWWLDIDLGRTPRRWAGVFL